MKEAIQRSLKPAIHLEREVHQGLPRKFTGDAQRAAMIVEHGDSHVTAHEIEADVAHGVHTRDALETEDVADAGDGGLEEFNVLEDFRVGHDGVRGVRKMRSVV